MPDWLVGLLIVLGGMSAVTLGMVADKLTRIIKLLEQLNRRKD